LPSGARILYCLMTVSAASGCICHGRKIDPTVDPIVDRRF
jgi:hypothetical protein